jgi:hypothetical protein
LKLSPMSSASRPIWYDGCAMEKLFARRLDMSQVMRQINFRHGHRMVLV